MCMAIPDTAAAKEFHRLLRDVPDPAARPFVSADFKHDILKYFLCKLNAIISTHFFTPTKWHASTTVIKLANLPSWTSELELLQCVLWQLARCCNDLKSQRFQSAPHGAMCHPLVLQSRPNTSNQVLQRHQLNPNESKSESQVTGHIMKRDENKTKKTQTVTVPVPYLTKTHLSDWVFQTLPKSDKVGDVSQSMSKLGKAKRLDFRKPWPVHTDHKNDLLAPAWAASSPKIMETVPLKCIRILAYMISRNITQLLNSTLGGGFRASSILRRFDVVRDLGKP